MSADGECEHCAADLLLQFLDAFPAFREELETIWRIFEYGEFPKRIVFK